MILLPWSHSLPDPTNFRVDAMKMVGRPRCLRAAATIVKRKSWVGPGLKSKNVTRYDRLVWMEGKMLPQPLPWKWGRSIVKKHGILAGSLTRCLTKDSNCSTPAYGITLKTSCCEPCEVLACLMQLYNLPSIAWLQWVNECFLCKDK